MPIGSSWNSWGKKMKKKRVCSICLNVVSEDEAIIDEEGRLLCMECFKKTYPLEESEEDEVT